MAKMINVSWDRMKKLLDDAVKNGKPYKYQQEVVTAGTYDDYEVVCVLTVGSNTYSYNYVLD